MPNMTTLLDSRSWLHVQKAEKRTPISAEIKPGKTQELELSLALEHARGYPRVIALDFISSQQFFPSQIEN